MFDRAPKLILQNCNLPLYSGFIFRAATKLYNYNKTINCHCKTLTITAHFESLQGHMYFVTWLIVNGTGI